MKRILSFLVIVAFVMAIGSGCAGYNFFCKPTSTQQSQAQIYLAKAQAVLAVLQSLPMTPQVQAGIAAIQLTITVFNNVITSVCQTTGVVTQAQTTVDAIKPVADQMKADYMAAMKK